MNQVEKASIGGYAFSFETEAYDAIRNYLEELGNFYAKRDSGSEIMQDIEERVAELLIEKCGAGGVVSRRHVEEVISILGRPEELENDFAQTEDAPGAKEATGADSKDGEKKKKRLMRDPENKVVGGVCSGLAATFDVDVVLLRVAFAVLTFIGIFSDWNWDTHSIGAFAPLLYVVLWIATPAANTVEQRWQMRGKGSTVDDISRTVSQGIKSAASDVRELRSKVPARGIWRVFCVVMGVLVLIIGVSGLSAGAALIVGKYTGPLSSLWSQLYDHLALDAPSLLAMLREPFYMVLLSLVIFLPFLGMLYGGLQMIMEFKSPKWHPGLVIFLLWMVAVVVFCITSVGAFTDYIDWDFFW